MELHNSLQYTAVLPSGQISDNTAQVCTIVDMQGYRSLEFVINVGTLADTNATFTVLVEEGAESDLSDNSAVADVDLLGVEAAATGASFTFADDDTIERIGYIGTKRYVRLTITPAGNTGAADLGVVAIQEPNHPPASVNV